MNNNNNKLVIMWLDELQDLAYDLDDILDEICTEAQLSESPIENEDKPDFGVKDRNEVKGWRKSESTSLVCEPHVYGRDEEKDKIIDLLLDDGGNCSDFCVIPIVGKGGIGKTTLSQLVYNDERVKKHFDTKAWAQVALHEALVDKRYFIVFDDVWSEKYEDWNSLRIPLRAGTKGSRILVTTRSRISASIMGTSRIHFSLEPLSDNDCWNLLQQHAFDGVDVTTNPNIVILEVKRCFAYCSILPKDYEFQEREVILFWMADGLLLHQESKKHMEDLGHDYFHGLVSRSFFEPSKIDDSRYKMHDLVNDLAQWAAGDICLRLDDMEKTLVCGPDNRIRHLSFIRRKHETVTRFEDRRDITSLRTFASFSLNYCGWSFLARNIGIDLIPKFGVLRVLSLSWYYIMKLPDSIGDLKHLRYLDISGTKVKELPETIGNLCNLQTLLLAHCELLEKLPTSTRKLVNLRHLDISETTSLQEMPVGIGTLVNLKTLSRFIVGNVDGRGIGELKNLRNLRGLLFVSRLDNVVSIKDALQTRLDDKLDLSGLQIEWARNFDLRDGEFEKNLLTLLRPPKKLKEYRLNCYGGEDFPSWLGEPSFTNMVTLTLKDCKNCRFLPSLGKLPSLKKLHIEGITRVKSVGVEFYGENCSKPFPSLKTLHFQRMEEWEEWFPPRVDESFPNLEKLLVINCPSLRKELPMHLPSLKKLEISKCLQLVVSPLSFPVLRELKIRECQAIVPEPATIDISNLKTLEIFQISELICLKEELIAQFTKLDTLHIENCMELASLWCCEKTLEEGLPLLHNLVIVNCPKLLFFPCEFQREQQRQMLFHGKLESLTLQGCEKLEILPLDLVNLRALSITNCSKLNSLFKNVLQSNIKKLNIRFCNSLESATEWISSCSSLVSLSISGCPSLLSIDQIPHTLQSMEIIKM
uniref:CC-NBS-LRR resistance-like protein n=1 Tax=Beta vulgaris subsp. vulgaris TaxID=3555 RepID=I6M4E0_BETVV|nr:CC-NBS-LRR resistance-like protein [Beta vulgaris subsp. vulgaris]